MRRKKKPVPYKKERALLSDVLPYEVPLTLTNRHFCEFLIENDVEYRNGAISWKKDDRALDSIMRFIAGLDKSKQIVTHQRIIAGNNMSVNAFSSLDAKALVSIPFGYKIRHKENEFRELTICHPRNQLQLVDFYHTYKELILYYCGVSTFSIRRPTRISRFTFHKDRAHYDALSDETVGVEEFDKEYESLRSFFVYEDYSYIFKFYDSEEFHRHEKKYNKLLRLDISKCFDSIYTHSIQWALLNKSNVKEHIGEANSTFAGHFDRLMQCMNYNETNGIIIGPEFSRVFAELILQSVDRAVLVGLSKKSLIHKRDYEIRRYVDDYFVFYNDEEHKDEIVQALHLKLKEFKLYLNSGKATHYEKPIITNISMAKNRIAELLNEKLAYRIEKIDLGVADASRKGMRSGRKGTIFVNSKNLITQFKTILKEAKVEYKDTLNYALYLIERRMLRIIADHRLVAQSEGFDLQLGEAILAICEFTFFIYSVAPRANTTIRLCRILQKFIVLLKDGNCGPDLKHSLFKLIFDSICLVLNKNSNSEHTPVETLYLLIALPELGANYWLDIEPLCSCVGIRVSSSNTFKTKAPLNYISIVVLLFYMKDKKKYSPLRDWLETMVIQKFQKKTATLRKDAELTLLLLDSLACPYLKPQTKRAILDIYGISGNAVQAEIIAKRKYWFTKWTAFNFGKELDFKQSQEVY
jgi:hypothetical protein